jgi:hypothetical protein
MKLTPTIRSTSDLLRKLERENYRVLHARNALHRADHFMNFCITAHSMQDHLLEHLGQVQAGTGNAFRVRWQKEPAILAAADIANSTKHFVLRDKKTKQTRSPQTKNVSRGSSEYVDIYEDRHGNYHAQLVSVPDYYVRLSDGSRHNLHGFMEAVLAFWRNELALHGVRVRRQRFENLSGSRNDAKFIEQKSA